MNLFNAEKLTGIYFPTLYKVLTKKTLNSKVDFQKSTILFSMGQFQWKKVYDAERLISIHKLYRLYFQIILGSTTLPRAKWPTFFDYVFQHEVRHSFQTDEPILEILVRFKI